MLLKMFKQQKQTIQNLLNKRPWFYINTQRIFGIKWPQPYIKIKNFINKIFKGKEEVFYKLAAPYKPYIYFFISAAVVTLVLFYFMTVLISQNTNLANKKNQNLFINFLSSKEVEDLKTKDRRISKKPKEVKQTPKTPKLKTKTKPLDKPKLTLPKNKLDLPKNLSKSNDFSGLGAGGSGYGDSDVTPIVRIEPNYPRKAAITGVEGFVILQFDISPLGTVINISILQASPPQIFNRSARQALTRWRYKPKIADSKAVIQKDLKVRLEFKLEK